jgi:hypothetical protein
MPSRPGTALAAAAMLAALAAIWLTGHGLVCAAWNGADSVRTPALCGGPRGIADIPQEELLYRAVIGALYRPQRFASARDPGGVLLVQAQTIDGAQYLDSAPLRNSIRHAALPASGDSLLLDFRARNAKSSTIDQYWGFSPQPTIIDSAYVRRILVASDSAALADPVVADVLTGLPLDSLPEILAISKAGVNRDATVALLFASLWSRKSREPGHLEAAAFVIAKRDGFQWKLAAEVPIDVPRGH